MNKKFKLFSFMVLMFFISFFINLDGVKAGEEDDVLTQNGYAKCYYFGYTITSSNSTRYYKVILENYSIKSSGIDTKKVAAYSSDEDIYSTKMNMDDIVWKNTMNAEALKYDKSTGFYKVYDTAEEGKNALLSKIGTNLHSEDGYQCPSRVSLVADGSNVAYISFIDVKTDSSCKPDSATTDYTRLDNFCTIVGTLELKRKCVSNSKDSVLGGSCEGSTISEAEDETLNESKEDNYNEDEVSKPFDIQKIINWANKAKNDPMKFSSGANDCSIISGELQNFLNILFWIIAIIGIILLIIMTIVEFIKVITLSEEDGLKGAFKHTVIRAVCIVILLLLPFIISAIITVINVNFGSYTDEKGNVHKYTIGQDGNPICSVGE